MNGESKNEFQQLAYRVDKLVEGEWIYDGTWTDPCMLARCMFNLGQIGKSIDEIRITKVWGDK